MSFGCKRCAARDALNPDWAPRLRIPGRCTFLLAFYCGITGELVTGAWAIYSRVSLKDDSQTVANQKLDLKKWAKGIHVRAQWFEERRSTRDRRPVKEEVLRLIRTGQLEGLVVWSLDRWGRDMTELVMELDEFSRRKFTFISLRDGISLDSASGMLHAHILAAFANFERERIRERTLAGIRRARTQRKIPGRHPDHCGCGVSGHHGRVKPRFKGMTFVGWDYPGGRFVPVKSERVKAVVGGLPP